MSLNSPSAPTSRPTVPDGLKQGAQDAAHDASQSDTVRLLGKAGFAAKGVLYIVIAGIAASVGFSGGGDASQTGAITTLSQQTYGTILLILLSVGLAGYSLLRLVHVYTNPSGDTGGKGAVMRVSYLFRALTYGGLTVYTVTELTGGGGGGGGGSEQQLTGQLLDLPGGVWIVAGIALVLLGVGVFQAKTAFTASFMEHMRTVSGTRHTVAKVSGVVGHAGRALLFITMGVLFGRAALQADASEAGGVDAALQTIASSPVGPIALTLVAASLAAYGVYCLCVARWGAVRRAG